MYSWSWNIKLILILLKYNIIYCYHWNIILHIINISTEYSIKLYKISKYLVSRLYFLTRFQEVHSLARSSNQFQKTTFQVFFSFPLKCSSKIYSWPSNLDYLSLSTTSLSLSHFRSLSLVNRPSSKFLLFLKSRGSWLFTRRKTDPQ